MAATETVAVVPTHILQKVVLPSADGESFCVRESQRKVRYILDYRGAKHPAVSAHHASQVIEQLGPENTKFSPWDLYNFLSHTGAGTAKCAERLPEGLEITKV